ncbi:MAG: transcriptional regulator [Candidatus Aegiribacteria sp.]|nr:transcriptional regulator [Candidatus Aegiribacteria sp.]
MAVPLLDIKRQHQPIIEDLRSVFNRALESSRFIKGPEMEQLEKEFAEYCGTERALGCASGTDALILALMAVGVKPGNFVLTTPFTFFASAGAIVRAGATPLFLDILPDTFNIDPELLSGWLTDNCAVTDRGVVIRNNGTRIGAVMPVHLFGQLADMDRIISICKDWHIPVVEDACQAVGAKWSNKRTGSLGTAGCFSFFPSKNLGALGDGGMVTTNLPEIAERIVSLREHGGRGYIHEEVGFNSRLDAIQAGFLRIKLAHLESWHKGRRKNARFYDRAFKSLGQVTTPVIREEAWSIYNQYTIKVPDRDGLLNYLRERGIGCAVYYPLPLHLQKCFECLGYGEGDFPVSEAVSKEVISIPVFGELTEEELVEVFETIKAFYAEKG